MKSGAASYSLKNLARGTYYARVSDASGMPSNSYTLSWATPSVKADAYEANNSLAKAKALNSTSGKLNATIHTGTDQDWYKFSLAQKGVSTNKITLSNANDSQRITLYNASGKVVKNAATSISLQGLAAGLYYVRVNDVQGVQSGSYTLNWNTPAIAKDSYESNEKRTTAKTLSANAASLKGTIHSPTDQDWFKFNLASTGTASNKLTLSGKSGQAIALYNSKGVQLSGYKKSQSLKGLAAGTYYARIIDSTGTASGAYTLSYNIKSASISRSASQTKITGPGNASVTLTADTTARGLNSVKASYSGKMLKSAKDGQILKGTSASEMLVAKNSEAIINPGAGNDVVLALDNSTVVFDSKNWGDNDIIYANNSQVDIVFNGLTKNDVSISGGGSKALTITKKSDASQKITVTNLDGNSSANIVYGGTMSQFNKYLNTASPSASLEKSAQQEVWKKTGILAS